MGSKSRSKKKNRTSRSTPTPEPEVSITLQSYDGERFVVTRKTANQMRRLRDQLDHCAETGDIVDLREVSRKYYLTIPTQDRISPDPTTLCTRVLKIVVEFCAMHQNEFRDYRPYQRGRGPYIRDPRHIKLFEGMDPTERTEIVNAAACLDVPRLTDAILAEAAHALEGMTAAQMRVALNLPGTSKE